jgi:hypothetical protein
MNIAKFLGYLLVLYLVIQSIVLFIGANVIGSKITGGNPTGYTFGGVMLACAVIIGLLVRRYL